MVEQEKTEQKETKSGTGKQTRKRIPLGTRNILTAPKKSGFVRRFVNDKGDRVSTFKEAGWAVVDEDIQVGDPKIGKASTTGSLVNPHVGGGQRAVLMELPEEYYAEDKAAAQAKITTVENEIRRNSQTPGSDGLDGKISIS